MATERRVLSSLEMLPEECQDDVVWALARLNERERTQTDILFELNDRLAVKGYGPISKSAFSRRSVRLKRRADRLAERDAMYAGMIERITPDKMAEQDIILGELLKALIDEFADEASSAKEIKALADAYKQTITAQNLSARLKTMAKADAKAEAEAEAEAKMSAQVDKAVETIARAKGITAETAEAIKAQILGVKAK